MYSYAARKSKNMYALYYFIKMSEYLMEDTEKKRRRGKKEADVGMRSTPCREDENSSRIIDIHPRLLLLCLKESVRKVKGIRTYVDSIVCLDGFYYSSLASLIRFSNLRSCGLFCAGKEKVFPLGWARSFMLCTLVRT